MHEHRGKCSGGESQSVRGIVRVLALCLVALLLAACGGPAAGRRAPATPTPLPPAPALQRQTFRVQRGAIERAVEVTGRVAPVDLSRLSFRRSGRVARLLVRQGDRAARGRVLAELEQDGALAALREAEDGLTQARRELETARGRRDLAVRSAELDLEQARDDLARARGGYAERAARRTVEQRELALREARLGDDDAQQAAVEEAERALAEARAAVAGGRIAAPSPGEVVAVAIAEGDGVRAYRPAIEVADPSKLEVAAELAPEQMRELTEGQEAEVRLLASPGEPLPAVIRRLPAPYGAGGSGAVRDQDPTTRLRITDIRGGELESGAVANVRVVLERKPSALWLPPDALREFEGRRFVVVREGARERRTPVRLGVQTEERVEILEGVEAGDVVVGQ